MKTFVISLAAFMMIMPRLPAAEPASAARESLIAAERAFAARAAATNNRTAFLEVLADDSVVFHPDAVNGKTWWTARPEKKAKLLWAPDFVVVAFSGDLGLSSGPWIFLDEKGVEVAAGRFTSIWKRDGDGPWKLALDHGIGFERQTGAPWEPESVDGGVVELPDDGSLQLDPQVLDRDLSHDKWLVILPYIARVQRDGQVPGDGKVFGGAPRWYAARSRAARWRPQGGGSSSDGTLAYSYGNYFLTSARPGEADETGVYIHVWRHGADGWKLILQQFNPANAK